MAMTTGKALLVLAISMAATWSGCGYRSLHARVPGGGERIFVPIVDNRTSHGGLTGALTNGLRRELERAGLDVVGAGTAAPELRVVIVTVRGGPGMLGIESERLVPVDNVWEISAEASVATPAGEDLAEPVLVTVDGRSLAGDGVAAEQALGARARDELIGRLAREIVRVVFEE